MITEITTTTTTSMLHCHHMPMSNTWFTTSKPPNHTFCTKRRKTMRHQLSKPYTFQWLFTQQPTRAYNFISHIRLWHYPLQSYTTFGIVNAFNMLLKLIFYQVTHITTIFKWCMGFPWGSHVVMSLPHFGQDGHNILRHQTLFTLLYMDLLQHK